VTAPGDSSTGRVGTAVSRRFPAVCASVWQARHFLRDQLDSVSYDPDVEFLALMLSELATNAVQHAGTEFAVGIWVTPDAEGRSVLVRVTDTAHGFPVPQEPTADAPHGRGLHIVESLADGWGIEMQQSRPGKTVWFRARVGPGDAGVGVRGQGEEDVPAPPALGRGRGRNGEVLSAS
jgi:anti-sigma regulatory factor (Ser/Thr protein kinase)